MKTGGGGDGTQFFKSRPISGINRPKSAYSTVSVGTVQSL